MWITAINMSQNTIQYFATFAEQVVTFAELIFFVNFIQK